MVRPSVSASGPRGRHLVPALALVLGLGPVVLGAAEGDASPTTAEATVAYDLPAQALDASLRAVASSAEFDLAYRPDLVAGRRAPALQGTLTPEAALRRLLAGSGLRLERLGDGRLAIRSGGDAGPGTDTEPPIVITGEGQEDEPIVIEGEQAGARYTAEAAPSTTRLPVPLLESPISVQVVPRAVLDEQGAQGLEDVYRNVSGVVEAGNTLNAQSEVLPFIRGFEAPVVLRDGMRATQVGAVDLVDIQSVEVLKGPASILFGALEPGGVLNYTTRQPSATPAYRAQAGVDSFGQFRGEVGATGPLAGDSLLYRVDAAYTDGDTFRDEVDVERFSIAPSLTWRANERLTLDLDLSYTEEELPYDSGIPLDADGDPLVDEDTFFGDPDLAGRNLEDLFIAAGAHYRLTEAWTLRSRVQFHRATPENESIRHRGVTGAPGAEQLRLRYQDEERDQREVQWVNEVLWSARTGAVQHEAVIGIDYSRLSNEFDRFRQNLPSVVISDDPDVNFDPPAHDLDPVIDSTREWIALYAHDHLTLLDDRLHILLGGRFDSVDEDDDLNDRSTDESEFTGRAGVLYQVDDHFAPFLSVSQSFQPAGPGTVDRSGAVLDPETGLQYEAGVKSTFLAGDLQATLAVYQIEKEDVAVFDLDYFFATGEQTWLPGVDQRSRGVEIDVTGQITDELRIIANYAYTDTEETDNATDPDREGARLGNVPYNALRIWAAYDFAPDSALEGFGLGLGLRYESERLTQFDEDVELDAFTVIDAAAWYRHQLSGGQQLQARLNVSNLFDEDYIVRASDQSIAHPGSPLAARLTLGIEF